MKSGNITPADLPTIKDQDMNDTNENTGWAGTGLSTDPDVRTVTIEPVSNRGKRTIKRLGNKWWMCRIEENLACFDGAMGILISPVGLAWHDNASRWVRANDWLRWDDHDLRLSAASILEHSDMPTFVPQAHNRASSDCV